MSTSLKECGRSSREKEAIHFLPNPIQISSPWALTWLASGRAFLHYYAVAAAAAFLHNPEACLSTMSLHCANTPENWVNIHKWREAASRVLQRGRRSWMEGEGHWLLQMRSWLPTERGTFWPDSREPTSISRHSSWTQANRRNRTESEGLAEWQVRAEHLRMESLNRKWIFERDNTYDMIKWNFILSNIDFSLLWIFAVYADLRRLTAVLYTDAVCIGHRILGWGTVGKREIRKKNQSLQTLSMFRWCIMQEAS